MKIRKVFIPGEHDWYLDMGKKWGELFGQPNWTFDHKGVRFLLLYISVDKAERFFNGGRFWQIPSDFVKDGEHVTDAVPTTGP